MLGRAATRRQTIPPPSAPADGSELKRHFRPIVKRPRRPRIPLHLFNAAAAESAMDQSFK
jgi:hypothetical protein